MKRPNTALSMSIYLILLCIAEIISASNNAQIGLFLHALIMISLFTHATLTKQVEVRQFVVILSLLPLMRLMSLVIPFLLFQTIYWYAVAGIPLFAAALIAARLVGLNRAAAGLTAGRPWLQFLIGLTGIPIGYLQYLILHPQAQISTLSLEQVWLPALIFLIFTGFLEELIFRGLLQGTAVRILAGWGILYSAAASAIFHIGYHSLTDLIFVFVISLLFGAAVRRSGSILGVTLAHGLTNMLLYLVYPFIIR